MANVEQIQALLRLAKIGAQFPDWNSSFIPPRLLNPDYVPPYNGQGVLPLSIILLVCMLIVVSLRIYARGWRRSSIWGWDDWCIIPATLITMAINFIAIVEYTSLGLGRHSYDLTWFQLETLYKLIFAHYILYLWAAFLIRLSLVIFYLRLLNKTTGGMALFIKCFMVYLALLTIVAHFAIIFAYSPVSAGYDLNARLEPYKALNAWVIITCLSSIYAVTDIITWLLPIRIIWKLRMSLRRRLGLFALFGLGGIVCVVVLIRTAILNRLYGTFDNTWAAGSVSLCSEIECNVGIIIACLPAINTMIVKAYNSSLSSIQARLHSFFGYSNDRTGPTVPTPSDPLDATLVGDEKLKSPVAVIAQPLEIDQVFLSRDEGDLVTKFSDEEKSLDRLDTAVAISPQPKSKKPGATFLLSQTQEAGSSENVSRLPLPSLKPANSSYSRKQDNNFLLSQTQGASPIGSPNPSLYSVDLIIQLNS